MLRRFSPITVALLACALLVSATASAPATPAPTVSPSAPSSSLLFVQGTRGGQLERLRSGLYRLTLSGVSRPVSTFTDRPRRRAGQQDVSAFVRGHGTGRSRVEQLV